MPAGSRSTGRSSSRTTSARSLTSAGGSSRRRSARSSSKRSGPVTASLEPTVAVVGTASEARGGGPRELLDPAFLGLGDQALGADERLLLEAAWEALEDAGAPIASLRGTTTGVYVAGADASVASCLARAFALRGPCIGVDAAGTPSLGGLRLAKSAILCDEVDAAIAAAITAHDASVVYV